MAKKSRKNILKGSRFTKPLLAIFVIVVLFLAYLWLNPLFVPGKTPSQPEPLAQAGEVVVFKKDLDYRLAVYGHCYSEVNQDKVDALAELLRDAIEQAVLMSAYNMPPSEPALEQKAKWIGETTRAPDALSCIKAVYKGDREAYMRNVVSPALVNPTLYDMFAADKTVHQKERQEVDLMLQQVSANPEALPEMSGYKEFEVLKQAPTDDSLLMMGIIFSPDPLIENVLVKLKQGELHNKVVEDEYSYRIIRLVAETDSAYLCDGVVLIKASFDDWFQKYVLENVPITIGDEQLKQALQERYPDLWWLGAKGE